MKLLTARAAALLASTVLGGGIGAGCASSSSNSQQTSSSPASSRSVSRSQACEKLANYVDGYNYIEKGTSVRAYDILFHQLQRSCPRAAHKHGLDGDSGTPSCQNLYDDRFKCQAFNDPHFAASPTSTIIDSYTNR